MTLLEALKRVPFLATLADDELGSVAAIGTVVAWPPATVVFGAGDPGDGIYVVVSGRLRIFLDSDGTEVDLSRLEPGDYFGEMAIIDGGPRAASVATVEASELLRFGRDAFLDLVGRSPKMLKGLLSELSERLRQSNRMMLEQERLRAAAEIEQHRTLLMMVAGIAHDINTPLGIVNQAASVIADSVRDKTLDALAKDEAARDELADVAEAARLILAGSQRARELVTAFKDASVRQLTARREVVDIEALLREVVGLYRFKARASRLAITIRGLGECDRRWEGYPAQLSQIVLNLLSNVERYAYPDGEGGAVEVELATDGEGYLIAVVDHGVGMSDAQRARLFEPFFTTGRAIGGSGLGLAIVREICTSLGGSIRVEGAPGAGTRVEVRLPRHSRALEDPSKELE